MTGRIATMMVIAILTAAVAARQPQPAPSGPLPDVTFKVAVNHVEVLEALSLIEPVRIVQRGIEIRVRA